MGICTGTHTTDHPFCFPTPHCRQEFEPHRFYWRVVLMMRKVALVIVSLFFGGNSMFQVRDGWLECVRTLSHT